MPGPLPDRRIIGAMEPEPKRDGPPDSERAAVAALRSRRHAEMLFDAVTAQLGELAWLETSNGGRIRRLFCRDRVDPTWIVPWPLLELSLGARIGIVSDWMRVGGGPAVDEAPRPESQPPKLRGLGPGEIRLYDGAEHIEIVYDDRGCQYETCRSAHPRPLAGLAQALAAAQANPTELLARFLAALDPGRHGPGRVLLPVAMPHGAAGVFRCGLRALRRALFDDRPGRTARQAVADGLTGKALGEGGTREEALAHWRIAVAEHPPWPEPAPRKEPPSELPPGTMLVRAPSPDVPMPGAVPEHVPAVLIPIEPVPAQAPGFGSWTALVGARGAVSFAACRRKRKGFTLIGQHVLAAVDPDRLDGEMDRVDKEHEALLAEAIARTPGGVARQPCRTTVYRVGDGGRLAFESGSEGAEWHADGLDGDVVARRVVRQRWVE